MEGLESLITPIKCPHCGQKNSIGKNVNIIDNFGDLTLRFSYKCPKCGFSTIISYNLEPINNGTPLVGAIEVNDQINFEFTPAVIEEFQDDWENEDLDWGEDEEE